MGKRTRREASPALNDEVTGDVKHLAPTSAPVQATARQEDATTTPAPRRRRQSIGRWIVYVTLFLVGGIVVAPLALRYGPLRDVVLRQATAGLPITLSITKLRCAWWAPVVIEGVTISDSQQHALAQIEQVVGDQPLYVWLQHPASFGTWIVRGADLRCGIRAGGSTWEDVLAQWPTSTSSSSMRPQGRIVIENGRLRAVGEDATAEVLADYACQATCELLTEPGTPWRVACQLQPTASATTRAESPETIELNGVFHEGPDQVPLQLQVRLQHASLATSRVASLRWGQTWQATGGLDGSLDLECAVQPTIMPRSLQANLSGTDLRWTPDVRGVEALATRRGRLQANVAASDGAIVIKQVDVEADWARAGMQWVIPQSLITQPFDAQRWLAECRGFITRGEVDLAALARQLPSTLRLRSGVEWEQGHVQWDLSQQASGEAMRWEGFVEAKDIEARQQGRALTLTAPLRVEYRLTQQGNQWQADSVAMRSAFIEASARGDWEQGRAELHGDLERCWQELSQFVEVDGVRLRGQCEAILQWDRPADDAWHLTTRAKGNAIEWLQGPTVRWQEPQFTLEANSAGEGTWWRPTAIASAHCQLTAGDDRLTLKSLAPLRGGWGTAIPACDVDCSGDLATWQRRLQPWIGPVAVTARGSLKAHAQLRGLPDVCQWSQGDVELKNFELATGTLRFIEPVVQIRSEGTYDLARQQVDCQVVSLASTSVSLRADQVRWPLVAGQEPTVLQYRGDLGKIWQRYVSPTGSLARGQLAGRFTLESQGQQFAARGSSQIQNFEWIARDLRRAPPDAAGTVVWREPTVALDLDGTWDAAQQVATLRQAKVATGAATLACEGTFRDLARNCVADVRGTTRLDLQQVTALLRPYYGDQLRLEGVIDRPFAAQGPLRVVSSTHSATTHLVSTNGAGNTAASWIPAELCAQMGTGWQAAHAFGFDVGQANIETRLEQQQVKITPFDLPVSGGELHLAPQVSLTPPYLMSMKAGRCVDQVAITRNMCQNWLKFVAPLLADATAAEGKFSVDLQQLSVPMLDPTTMQAAAQLAIHTGQVGPGPLAQEIIQVVRQARTLLKSGGLGAADNEPDAWVVLPEQQVPVRVSEGRVYHEQLTMQIGDATLRTSGWVGFDQQMALQVEMGVPSEWVAEHRWLKHLAGQTLQIPVRGTVQRPQIDRSILQQLTQQGVRGAAEGFLQDELQRQFQKLLPGR